MTIRCINCGLDNQPGALLCAQCGRLLTNAVSTRRIDRTDDTPVPAWTATPMLAENELLIELPATGKIIKVALPDAGIIVGRRDEVSGKKPDLDLSDHMSLPWDVSRRHAWIGRVDGKFIIRDLKSTNGVDLNGRRIEPNIDTPLPNGATVRLGLIVLRLFTGHSP